jgi:hypothetical protein
MFLAPFAVAGYRHWDKKRQERLVDENGGPEQPAGCEKDEAHADSTDADGKVSSIKDSEAIKSDSSVKTQCTVDMSEDNSSAGSSDADETEFQKGEAPAHGTEIDDAGSSGSQGSHGDETGAAEGQLVLSRDTMEHEDTETPTMSPSTSPLASLSTRAKEAPGPFAGFRKLFADLWQPEQDSAQDSARKYLRAATPSGKVGALTMAEEARPQKFFYVDGRKIPMPKISYK